MFQKSEVVASLQPALPKKPEKWMRASRAGNFEVVFACGSMNLFPASMPSLEAPEGIPWWARATSS